MARIFISYRRQDSAYPAGILRDALQARFGTDSVFLDLDNIPFGIDFRQYIGTAVGQCDVLLALIGDQWLQLTDDQGRRRIEGLSDSVRIEIESALKRDIPVVPVLVEEAKMPTASELPESIRDLAYRNAAEIGRGRDQKQQIERLVSDLERNWPAKVSDAEEEKPAAPEEEEPSAPEPREAMARPKVRKSTKAKPQAAESATAKSTPAISQPDLDQQVAFLDKARKAFKDVKSSSLWFRGAQPERDRKETSEQEGDDQPTFEETRKKFLDLLWKCVPRRLRLPLVALIVIGATLVSTQSFWYRPLDSWVHFFFLREPAFSKNVTGVLVTRIVDDDVLNSLQGALVGKLNAELQKEETGQQIEVHASREVLNENDGLKVAHKRAQAIGERLNAKMVIWGRKIGEKQFYPRITVMAAPKDWHGVRERTHDEQTITELHLPKELVDEPFYLIHFAAGYSYYVQEKYGEALPHFQAALGRKGALANELADLRFFTAVCYYSLGANDEAIADYDKVIRIDPKYLKAYNNRGNVYHNKGDYDRALADFEEAIRLDPKLAIPHNNRGNVYFNKGDYNKALADYDEAIRLDPKYAEAYNHRGNVYFNKGDYNKALADYDEAIRLDPKYAGAYNSRGNVYLDRGDYDKALADYDEAIRLDPKSPPAYNNRGNVYHNKGDYDKALADYDEAVRLNPKVAGAYNNRGNVYEGKQNYDKALADYDKAIRLDPKFEGAYNRYAWLLATCPQARFRDGKKAVEHATKACELSEWKEPSFVDTLAAAYAEAGDFELAIKSEMKYLETSNLAEKDAADGKSRLALYQARKPYHAEK